MNRRTIAVVVCVLVFPAVSAAQPAPPATKPDGTPIPRTADGRADLSGVWNKRLVVNTAVTAEPLPFTAEGLKAFNDVWNHIDPTSKCIFPGVPRVNTSPYPFQIIQLPDTARVVSETALPDGCGPVGSYAHQLVAKQ